MPTGHKADGSPSGTPPPPIGAVAVYRRQWTPKERGYWMAHAWKRRADGLTAHQIAAEIGCTPGQVRMLWSEFKRQNPLPDLEEQRLVQLDRMAKNRQRLEHLLALCMARGEVAITEQGFTVVVGADTEGARKVLADLAKLEERESKFLGLDAPEKREVEVTVQSDEERQMKKLFDRIQEAQP